MNLFNSGEFTLNSGRKAFYKIDCDALTDKDIDCLARLVKDNLPLFAWVEGVPTGGLRLAEALKPLAEPNLPHVTVGLIVDDVLTTGNSMEKQRDGRAAMGVVIFNRMHNDHITPGWIKSIWRIGL